MMRLATAMCGMLKVGSSSDVVSTCVSEREGPVEGQLGERRLGARIKQEESRLAMKKIQYDLHTPNLRQ